MGRGHLPIRHQPNPDRAPAAAGIDGRMEPPPETLPLRRCHERQWIEDLNFDAAI
jgi:hypothetical protein